MSKRLILSSMALMLLSMQGCAWMPETYEVSAKRLCDIYDCSCEAAVVAASTEPDRSFKDQPTHHCYKPQIDHMAYISDMEPSADTPFCPDFVDEGDWLLAKDCYHPELDRNGFKKDQWKKPVLNECPALDKAILWLESAEEKQGCKRWHDIGVALHYFMDAKEFWNNVILVNRTCVADHEDLVNDYMQYDSQAFRACSCGVCNSRDDFDGWLLEFAQRVKPLVEASHGENPHALVLHNDLDAPAAKRLMEGLASANITSRSSSELGKGRMQEFIIIIGGHRAPGVGPIADSVLTDGDKDKILKSIFTGASIKKKDVWASGQTVVFIAGHGINETADAVSGMQDKLAEEIQAAHEANTKDVECIKNDDCGSPYWGPWVCTNRIRASRVRYAPFCEAGSCGLRADRPTSKSCVNGRWCKPLFGCLSDEKLIEFKTHEVPLFTSWLSHARQTAIVGRNITYSIYIRHNITGSIENFTCERYTDDDWEEISGNFTRKMEVRYQLQSNTTGRHTVTNRIRCGNQSGSADLIPLYYVEHNFTAQIMPPALSFTFTLDPQLIQLEDCFDGANVTLKIENLAGRPLVCNYSLYRYSGQATVNSSSQAYNVTGGYWSWVRENVTYDILSYYSGSDFLNQTGNGTTVTKIDEDGNVTVYNYSNIIPIYANEIQQVTINTPTFYYNVSNTTYEWSYSPWSESTFYIDSDQCAVYKHLATVTCIDEYGQVSTLKKDLMLNLTHLPRGAYVCGS